MLTKILLKILRIMPARVTLRSLLHLDNILYELISHEAIRYNGGIHPKHRLTDYHNFFIRNINRGEKVIDIGCGSGELTYDIAIHSEPSLIIGVDMNRKSLERAKRYFGNKTSKLKFILGKAPENIPIEHFDVVILSNVLEHQYNRVQFLKEIIKRVKPKKILIRVPFLERDWRIPLKRELGVRYFTDPTHYVEYTLDEFAEEIYSAQLKIEKMIVKWGRYGQYAPQESN